MKVNHIQASDKADGVLQLAWSNEWANGEEFQQAPISSRATQTCREGQCDFGEAYKRGMQEQQRSPVGTRAHGHGFTATGWWHSVCRFLSMSPFCAAVPRGQL